MYLSPHALIELEIGQAYFKRLKTPQHNHKQVINIIKKCRSTNMKIVRA